MGVLYLVATPIGNLKDITLRAVDVLKNVDLILCEDTRVTKKLLRAYDVKTITKSYHQHSKDSIGEKIIQEITQGKNIALVTDAGTPGISDPGNKLVALAIKNNVRVESIPGPSAIGTIVSVSGIDMQRFVFLAYPPHKKGRKTFFERVNSFVQDNIPVIYYDSVYRVIKNLEFLRKINFNCQIILGRELTKMHEEILRGGIKEVVDYFYNYPEKLKGEFVIVVYQK